MKNIHILPTDKPSRLAILGMSNNIQLFDKPITFKTFGRSPQNIYITNDEEIKERDWFLNTLNNQVNKCDDLIYEKNVNLSSWCKKIILTTDQDLIKDGVQAIDDEFLEWFVKNPSCENVQVIKNKKLSSKSIWDAKKGDLVFNNHGFGGIIQELSNDIRVHILSENGEGYMETAITSDNGKDTLIINNYKVYEYTDYKIIIPKEEPKCTCKEHDPYCCQVHGSCPTCVKKEEAKQELPQFGTKEFNDLASQYFGGKQKIHLEDVFNDEKKQGLKEFIDNHKQETLEEAGKDYIENTMKFSFDSLETKTQANRMLKCIEFGAKWQQERSYSEEDMEIIEISSIDANYIPHYQTKEGQLLATKFNVKQFKKK